MRRRNLFSAARILLVCSVFLVCGMQPVQAKTSLQINSLCSSEIEVMPLGDSITTGKYSGSDTSNTPEGAMDDIGYRKDLWNLLTNDGYSVDFVGTQSNGDVPSSPFSDPEHEGHNGYTDAQIALNIYNNGGENWLNQNPPDVILIHIGTNNLDTDPTQVEQILDEINEYQADTDRNVVVIVARIIDIVPNNPVVTLFNDNVKAMVSARPGFGTSLFLVDMQDGAGLIYSKQPVGDMWDSLHPFATGYAKMAKVWKAAFDNLCHELYLPLVFKFD